MDPFTLSPVLFFSLLGFMLFLFIALISFLLYFMTYENKDYAFFIDKANRWSVFRGKFGDNNIKRGKRLYINQEDSALLSRKGKKLLVYAENKPNPLKISYTGTKWLTSESLMATINNEIVKSMVKLSDKVKDMLMMYGSIAAIVSAGISAAILLKIMGVF